MRTAGGRRASRISPGRDRARILVVGPTPPPTHGVAALTEYLLRSRLSERYELVHVDTSDRRGVDNIGRVELGNILLAGRHAFRFMLALRRGADVVYLPVSRNVPGFVRDALFLLPAVARGMPIVAHLHSGGYDEFMERSLPPVRALVRRLLARADRVIVLGEVFRAMLRGWVPDGSIAVVPNGVPDAFAAAPRAARGSEEVEVLFLGNLISTKGPLELIESVEVLAGEGRGVRLTLAGGVAESRTYERVVAAADRSNGRIRYVGSVHGEARNELLQQADILALPTYYENEAHPLVLLEAMSAGLPVVSTRHAAVPEIVRDGQTGLLVTPGSVAELTGALRRLVGDPPLRARMGAAARELYLTRYTLDAWAGRMEQVFDGVLQA